MRELEICEFKSPNIKKKKKVYYTQVEKAQDMGLYKPEG